MAQIIIKDITIIFKNYFISGSLSGIMFIIMIAMFRWVFLKVVKSTATQSGFIQLVGSEKRNFYSYITYLYLLYLYCFFLVQITYFSRVPHSRIGFSLQIFGTYSSDMQSIVYLIENFFLLIPMGILLSLMNQKFRSIKTAALLGTVISLSIECLQLITGRGYFQVDDIIMNVLGIMIATGLTKFIIKCPATKVGSALRDKKIVTFLPAITLMIIIFLFSAKTGEQSSGMSLKITKNILFSIEYLFNFVFSPKDELTFLNLMHTMIRKSAHMLEYAVLAVLVAYPLYVYHKRGSKLVVWCMSVCILYAGSDEIHQLFIVNRSGQLMDVLIDSIGATCGLLLFCRYKKSKTN